MPASRGLVIGRAAPRRRSQDVGVERDGEWYDADQMGLWEHQGDPLRVGELMRLLEDIDETL